MKEIAGRVNDWRTAGIITSAQAKDIKSYEKRRASASPTSADEGRTAPVAEALGYVGAAIALAAVAILLGEQWETLNVAGRLAAVGFLSLIMAGAALALRSNAREPIQRLVSVLSVATLGGVGWLIGILLTEVTDWRTSEITLIVAAAEFVLAVALYLVRRRALPQLAAFGSLVVLVAAAFDRPAFVGGVSWDSIATWGIGVIWVLLVLGGWHKPDTLAVILGSVAALAGAQVAAMSDGRAWLLWLGLATATALLWRGVIVDTIVMVALGSIGVLVFVPQIVLEVFPEGSGAVVAMLVTGLLLVLLSVFIARGRWGSGDTEAETDAKEDTP